MMVNADFARRVMVDAALYDWVASPQPGVERVMLDRTGGAQARATSIVRYAPGSHYPAHEHPGGEEILVLSGVFSEDEWHYPAGWYLRNPPGSAHLPSSGTGALLFVKLGQMAPGERSAVRIDTRRPELWQEGVCRLFAGATEKVSLQRLAPHEALSRAHAAADTTEILLVSGILLAGERALRCGSWLRLPPGDRMHLAAGGQGAIIYLKTWS